MLKHIFGATSSPGVLNFCLKKTAMMEEQQNSEIANVINRNMYVDDLMKSTETAADAISDLISLFPLPLNKYEYKY